MNAPCPGDPVWQKGLERPRRLYLRSRSHDEAHRAAGILIREREVEEARRGEWAATPPGRLARRLVADIEPYLGFFAIARAE